MSSVHYSDKVLARATTNADGTRRGSLCRAWVFHNYAKWSPLLQCNTMLPPKQHTCLTPPIVGKATSRGAAPSWPRGTASLLGHIRPGSVCAKTCDITPAPYLCIHIPTSTRGRINSNDSSSIGNNNNSEATTAATTTVPKHWWRIL